MDVPRAWTAQAAPIEGEHQSCASGESESVRNHEASTCTFTFFCHPKKLPELCPCMVTKSNNSADFRQIYESDYLGLPACRGGD